MDEGANGLMADQLITGTTLIEKESRSIGDAPVGSIVAWAKTLSGVPNLAEGWVECDGSVLVDALSPLNGQTIPDLNGGEFLRGNTTSGGTGGSATMAHTHDTNIANVGNLGLNEIGIISDGDFPTSDISVTSEGIYEATASLETRTGFFEAYKTINQNNAENRPPFYNVIWIMRVR